MEGEGERRWMEDGMKRGGGRGKGERERDCSTWLSKHVIGTQSW